MGFSQDINDKYEKFIRRMNPPRVVIDNESCKNATVIQVDSANKHGILLEVVQVLSDLNLIITKAYISSDGGWFMDVFNVTDQNGNKITEEGILDYIKKSLGPDVCFTSSERSVGVTPSVDHTSIELIGTDRPGLLSEVIAVLTQLKCNVVSAEVWTRNTRAAAVMQVIDEETGGAISDPERLSMIKQLLCNVLKGSNKSREAKTVVSHGATHTERRLHQTMLADRDYERPSDEASGIIARAEGKFCGLGISYQNQESSSGSTIQADSQWNPISDPSHLVSPPSNYSESKSPGFFDAIHKSIDAIHKFLAENTAVKKPVRIYHGDTPADKWVPFEKLAVPEFLMNDDDEESGGGGEKYYFLKVDPHFQARVSTDMQLKKFDGLRRIHLVQNGEWALEFSEDKAYRSFVKEFDYCLLKNSPNARRKRFIMGQSSPAEVPVDPGFLTRRSIDEWVDEAKLLLGFTASACYASPSTFPRVANGLGFAACLVAVSLRHTAGGAATGILVKFGALGCAAGVLAAMAKDLPQEYILAPVVAFLLIAAVVGRAR